MTMNFCPHCGHRLQAAGTVTTAPAQQAGILPSVLEDSDIDHEVVERLRPKVVDLFKGIDGMSEDEFGDWVDALPRDEFIVWIALGVRGLRELAYGGGVDASADVEEPVHG